MPEWVEIVVSILSGLAITIPLVIKLVEFVQQSIKEKNWTKLLELVTGFMQEAEKKFETGAEKKDYVMLAIKASADTVNYDIDMDVVSKLVDDLVAMSKIVNAPVDVLTEEVKEEVQEG